MQSNGNEGWEEGGVMHFVTRLFALAKALPAGAKPVGRVRNTVEEHLSDTM